MPLKARHHTARRAQHVTEAHRQKTAGGAPAQVLADQFRKALGGAHDIGRVHRLVGGDEHEALAPPARRCLRHDLGAVSGERRERLDLSGLSAGVYFLETTIADRPQRTRITKF